MNNRNQTANKLFCLLAPALVVALAAGTADAGLMISESFETDGEGTRWVSTGEFKDTTASYFMRTNNQQASGQFLFDPPSGTTQDRRYSINGASLTYTGMDGQWVWAAENVDAGGPLPARVTLNTVNIAPYSEKIWFRGLFGGTFADTADYMRVSYSLDGGPFVQALNFVTVATGNTQLIALDTNGDGRGDPGPNWGAPRALGAQPGKLRWTHRDDSFGCRNGRSP